jgi:hypothetical protein
VELDLRFHLRLQRQLHRLVLFKSSSWLVLGLFNDASSITSAILTPKGSKRKGSLLTCFKVLSCNLQGGLCKTSQVGRPPGRDSNPGPPVGMLVTRPRLRSRA